MSYSVDKKVVILTGKIKSKKSDKSVIIKERWCVLENGTILAECRSKRIAEEIRDSMSQTHPSREQHRFKLLKNWGGHKKGAIFDCYGGLVCGITAKPNIVIKDSTSIDFVDKNYFEYVG